MSSDLNIIGLFLLPKSLHLISNALKCIGTWGAYDAPNRHGPRAFWRSPLVILLHFASIKIRARQLCKMSTTLGLQ